MIYQKNLHLLWQSLDQKNRARSIRPILCFLVLAIANFCCEFCYVFMQTFASIEIALS